MTQARKLIIWAGALGVAFVAGWAAPRPMAERSAASFPGTPTAGLSPRTVAARGELAQVEQATIALFQATSPSVVQVVARSSFPGSEGFGTGTGWIWDQDRHIVTNHHVVAGANAVAVRLSTGELVEAEVIGAAPQYDLAVLRTREPLRAAPLALGASEDLRVGQAVFAIGNPFGLEGSLTSGIVSALNRNLPTREGREILDLVQTDAAINPGNSGGPLLDSAGRVVGVNTAIVSPSGAYAGVGFAIPVDTVRRVVPLLIAQGRAPTPGIGVSLIPPDQAASVGVEGLLVGAVAPGGPADRAGLRGTDFQRRELGDVIVAADGVPVRQLADLLRVLESKGVGKEIRLTVLRGKERRTFAVPIVDIGA